MLADILVYAVLIGLVVLFVALLVNGSFSAKRGSNGASLTAFHDFQPKDKRNAVEVIVQEKAGKRWQEQENGEGAGDTPPGSEREKRK